jgi:transposase
MRRVNCRRCGIVAVEEVPWGDGKRTLTKAYMLFLARWSRRLSWKETAEAFRTSWDKVFDAVERVVTFGLEHRVLGNMPKGHKYLTLVYQIDLDVIRLGHSFMDMGLIGKWFVFAFLVLWAFILTVA